MGTHRDLMTVRYTVRPIVPLSARRATSERGRWATIVATTATHSPPVSGQATARPMSRNEKPFRRSAQAKAGSTTPLATTTWPSPTPAIPCT